MIFLILALSSFTLTSCKVFFVPHSHNDVGWLLTPLDYYNSSSKHILSNMILLLESFPALKFCWAEVYFLQLWLEEYPEQVDTVKGLIQSGRFEIVGGGWVQNDEATADLELTLRQMETGFNYLKKTLNLEKIRVAWQIDPFGHSLLTASLLEKLGFEVLFFARMETKKKVKPKQVELASSKRLEFIWKGEGLGAQKGILVHTLRYHYSTPRFIRYNYYDWEEDPRCFESLPATEEEMGLW